MTTSTASLNLVTINSHGSQMLGRMFVATGEQLKTTVLLLHGFPGTEQNFDLAHALLDAGVNVLHIHYRGAWGSGGLFSFANTLEDVAAALDFLRQSRSLTDYAIDPQKIVLIGHSMGGFAALMGAMNDPAVFGVAGLASANFGKAGRLLRNQPDKITSRVVSMMGSLPPLNGANAKTLLQEYITQGDAWDIELRAGQLANRHVLLIGAAQDDVLPTKVFHTPIVQAFQATGAQHLQHDILDAGHGFIGVRTQLVATVLNWVLQISSHA